MIYLLYGNERTMILNRIKKIRKELFSSSEENIVNFDLSSNKIFEVIDEIDQSFKYVDNKIIVVHTPDFYLSETKSKQDKARINDL